MHQAASITPRQLLRVSESRRSFISQGFLVPPIAVAGDLDAARAFAASVVERTNSRRHDQEAEPSRRLPRCSVRRSSGCVRRLQLRRGAKARVETHGSGR
jgi:hypothetical protein